MCLSRLRTILLLTCALVASTLLAAPASTLAAEQAGESEFQEQGCYRDATGDAAGFNAADLVEVCVNHNDSGRISAIIQMAGPIDPAGDPAWANDGTFVSLGLSADGDSSPEVVLILQQRDGTPGVRAEDGSGQPIEGCPVTSGQFGATRVFIVVERSCLGDPDDIRAGVVSSYEQTEGQAVAVDRLPDSELSSPPLATGDAPPFCDNHTETGEQVIVARIACGLNNTTEPISQGVAVSQFVFDQFDTPEFESYLGRYAVIVRDDNFADALAGSSLGFGQGPLLFTYSPTSGPRLGQDHTRLAGATAQELLRTVSRGLPVYVLGGTAAVDEGVVNHLRELGYDPIRLAGPTREDTAAVVAREVRRVVVDFAARNPDFPDVNMVLIANRDNWPDAVLAGQVGALWGMPILLNPATGPGHPATLQVLEEIRPDAIQFIGGGAVITSETLNAIRDFSIARGFAVGRAGEAQATHDTSVPWRQFCARDPELREAFWACRQGGEGRLATAAAVSQFGREMILRFGQDTSLIPENEVYASGVPLGGGPDSDNYAYVLAASMMSGRFGGAVFLPTEHGNLTNEIKGSVCDLDRGKDTNGDGTLDTPFIEFVELVALMSDRDKLPDSFGQEISDLITNGCPPEFQAAVPAVGTTAD